MKKLSLLLIFLVIGLIVVSALDKSYSNNGKTLFMLKGCEGCHKEDKGMNAKPFPTKQQMANISKHNFFTFVKNGKPGTAMKAYQLKDSEIEAIWSYVQAYK